LLDERWDAIEPIEEAVMRVQMQMSKLTLGHWRSPRGSEQTNKTVMRWL
jgi:hypothetical protein